MQCMSKRSTGSFAGRRSTLREFTGGRSSVFHYKRRARELLGVDQSAARISLLAGRATLDFISHGVVPGQLLELIGHVTGQKSEPRMTRFLAAQLALSHYFNISAARRDLHYEPEISMAEGMSRLLRIRHGKEPKGRKGLKGKDYRKDTPCCGESFWQSRWLVR